MLGIFVIAGCVLMTCAGPPISGYTLGTLTGGRGQEYSSGYRSGGYGLKDGQQADDHGASSRYSVLSSSGSHSTPGTAYSSSDSGYSDSSIAGSHAGGFGGHTGVITPETASAGSSSASYSSNAGSGSSSELTGSAAYSSTGSTSGSNSGYASGNAATNGNQGASEFLGYSGLSGSSHSGLSSGLSGSENSEFSSASHPSNPYVTYASHFGGPKPSHYSSASTSGHGNSHSTYSSPGMSFSIAGPHPRPMASHLSSSYSSDQGHSGISPAGPNYSSGHPPSMSNSFLNSVHSHNYIPHGGHHRVPSSPTSGHHIYASASNPSSSYALRSPGTGFFTAGSPFVRSGSQKIIILKESPHHAGHMAPVDSHNGYPNAGMFSPGNGPASYKIRSVASSTGNYGPPMNFAGYSSAPSNYAPSHSSNNHGSSFFSFL